ncbi:MAG: UDP-N-acetylmuramoyl-L-alanyl-D-glutamate--2,6-diaminopimelate ligase [Coriobacteriales bacterium]|jgi:UDP-N-acetylmuramoyl-L-alanyl-D-glutamate--2,6-diaminopimelate ligase|nr:UDP-N-acetylmuramoyl-L-alanyl-D-glutamate--2,6-diaminopimelate ligase [Coriobacteriales bacterium]
MRPRQLGALVADLDQRIDAATDVAALRALEIVDLAYQSDAVRLGSLFFCIPGSRADGHDFAADAAARGAVALAVEHPVPADLPQIRFESTRLALALTSRAFFDDPSTSLSITGVTGTNGKTTTTFLIDWICRFALAQRADVDAPSLPVQRAEADTPLSFAQRAAADTLSVPAQRVTADVSLSRTGLIGTVETRVGLSRLPSKFTTPESLDLQRLLAQMRDTDVTHVCMEVSSHAIALERVAGVDFAVAVFTNLSQDHLDFHGSMEDYFETKASFILSPLVSRRVIDIDTEYGRRLARRCTEAGLEILTCGFSEDAQVRAENVHYRTQCSSLTLCVPDGDFPLTYPLIGPFNVSNVLVAAASAFALGFSWAEIARALASSPQIPGRLERVRAQGLKPDDTRQPPVGVFVDYSHTPDSIEKALDALSQIRTSRTLIVFGCGGDRDVTKRPLMGKAALAADHVVVTSDNPRTEDPLRIIADILPGMEGAEDRYEVEPDRRRAIARALAAAQPGDLVLIAGKGHEDYQLVKDQVLDFDDRLVAAEELRKLADGGHWSSPGAGSLSFSDGEQEHSVAAQGRFDGGQEHFDNAQEHPGDTQEHSDDVLVQAEKSGVSCG